MTDTETLQMSPDQVEAIEKVELWWAEASKGEAPQAFTLAGYAGTGKTTIIAEILKRYPRTVVAAPTGKAAQRLREKDVNACTVHQLAYMFQGYDEDGGLVFDFVGVRGQMPLVIVDEASMIDAKIHRDLLSTGRLFLFVGDHGQLPPVGDDPGLMRAPSYELTTIHRQDDEGLLDYAHKLRQGVRHPEAWGSVTERVMAPGGEGPGDWEAMLAADNLVCWTNKSRHWLNHQLMKLRGVIPEDLRYDPDSALPVVDAILAAEEPREIRCVCLVNSWKYGFCNGEVVDFTFHERRGQMLVVGLYLPQRDKVQEFVVDVGGFRLTKRGYRPSEEWLMFDFGYALTAHKSQGSEWPHVCVYDDTHRSYRERPRWAYTAATRAQEKLTWIRR